jgi:predicted NBD/HSP70 family sugar kinase
VQTFGPLARLGVSIAGIVADDRGEVRLCRVAPWMNGEVVRRLKEELGDCHVALVNDGEATSLRISRCRSCATRRSASRSVPLSDSR